MSKVETKNYDGMSKTKVVNAIRREWNTCDQKRFAIERCVERIELPNGRMKSLVRCQSCSQLVDRQDAQCHHKNEVGPLASTSPEDIKAYRERMFPGAYLLMPLCADCHHKHHHKN